MATAGGWRRLSIDELLRPTLNGISRRNRKLILKLFATYIAFVIGCNNVVDINSLEFALQYGI